MSDTLRRGWTTGACATAATRAAYQALLTGGFPDPVSITLPRGERPSFALACEMVNRDSAMAGVIKDAGDDPDVTHGALVMATVSRGEPGTGVRFRAGPGVGTVTRAGLPLAVGEPAINPVPRALMQATIADLAGHYGDAGDITIEIAVEDGERLALQTWNPRLGILGGLSILGTTGIVVPFSCSAWIHSIHRGIDVARANGIEHVAGCTGPTSEAAVRARLGLSDLALIDMGDFAGGMLKYLRRHPVPRLTIGGGFAKLAKLARGSLDLHSGRSQVDLDWLADQLRAAGGDDGPARGAHTALGILTIAATQAVPLADEIARQARDAAQAVLDGAPVVVDVLVFDRQGALIGQSDA
ncbi:MAG: cobalt-precorrin-5B (C(1))-methyltransferase [Azospirillaceae bacterium]|nr:cobalt-precorrin-5B (C(1))-methyltransferase [Azospirillaceae bacterium]